MNHNDSGFLKSIQTTHPNLWESILASSKSGLIVIDQQNDSITATNRLLLTYPDLHEAISTLVNEWEQIHLKQNSKSYFNHITNELTKEDKSNGKN